MANTIPRHLSSFRNILLLVLLTCNSGCIGIPDYCMGGNEYTAYTVDLHVVESNASLQHFTEVRTMKLQSYNQEPDIYSAFGQGVRYSADGSALAFNTVDVQFLHYGVTDASDDSLWKAQQSVGIYPGYHPFKDTDIYPPKHEITFPVQNYDTLKNPDTGQHYMSRLTESTLEIQSIPGNNPQTLQSYKATFL